jgi:hypothetical protein
MLTKVQTNEIFISFPRPPLGTSTMLKQKFRSKHGFLIVVFFNDNFTLIVPNLDTLSNLRCIHQDMDPRHFLLLFSVRCPVLDVFIQRNNRLSTGNDSHLSFKCTTPLNYDPALRSRSKKFWIRYTVIKLSQIHFWKWPLPFRNLLNFQPRSF